MQYQHCFSTRTLAIVGLILTNVFWVGNIYVSKVFVGVVPPFTLNIYRWLIAALILTPFALKEVKTSWPLIRQSWLKLSFFGFLSIAVYNAFLYSAAHTTAGINIAVISSLTPLLTFIFTWLFFGLKPSRLQVIGFFFGISGVLLLISKGSSDVLLTLRFHLGDLLMFLACLAWSLYTAFLVKRPTSLSAVVFLYATIILGVLISMPMMLLEYQLVGGFHLNKKVLLGLIYIGLFPSLFSYLFYNNGVRVLGPQIASLSLYLLPVFTAIMSIIFLKETIHWFHIVSQLLVFIGFCFALLQTR